MTGELCSSSKYEYGANITLLLPTRVSHIVHRTFSSVALRANTPCSPSSAGCFARPVSCNQHIFCSHTIVPHKSHRKGLHTNGCRAKRRPEEQHDRSCNSASTALPLVVQGQNTPRQTTNTRRIDRGVGKGYKNYWGFGGKKNQGKK